MNLKRSAHEIEFRDGHGQDHTLQVDVWADVGGVRAVLVMRNLHPGELQLHDPELLERAQAAFQAMTQDWLPYLLRPEAEVIVLVLRPPQENRKARAVVLPLSA